ncbi:glycoside hydrolase family 16 protein [Robertkochia sediminum]|uniref:glycoside hydrolase family 16 protein n=1 Tax=Robertkochia sediminum TaxID=2785326 RepID=UPI0019322E9F|nr:glycoside hydrolase family 16 protein [Robertkochia sediminum]MBL7473981.1 glycoside hydrolase family 16 protein [Robertkochia sediminum]
MKNLFYVATLALFFMSCKQEKTLILHEDFSGDTLDTSVWSFALGDGCPQACGWGNNELQVYTDNNHHLEDGKLIITAKQDTSGYTATRINTKGKFEFQYGTVEMKAKLPAGKGTWPAFWLLGSNIDQVGWPACGEVDIMEYAGREPGIIHTSMHTPSSYGRTVNTEKNMIPNIEEGFHTYTANWTPEAITFSIDGKKVYTYAPEVKNAETWPYDQPFYILLNLAVGGTFGGTEIDNSIFPVTYEIDYVKVWEYQN